MSDTSATGPAAAPHATSLTLAICAGFVTVAIYVLRDIDRDTKALAAAAVLAMPVFLLCLCTRLESKLFTQVIAIVEFVRIIAVNVFCQIQSNSSQGWAYFLLALALFAMAATVFLARSITTPFDRPRWLSRLSEQAHGRSKLLAWAVFVLFLQIATLLGLALGVHDKANAGASIAETRPPEDYLRAEAFVAQDAVSLNATKLLYRPGCPSGSQGRSCISAEAMADLFGQPDVVKAVRGQAAVTASMLAVVKKHLIGFETAKLDKSVDPVVVTFAEETIALTSRNLIHLYELMGHIEDKCGRFGEEDPPCIVTILGHATDAVGRAGPAGNEQLASQRAAHTHELLRMLAKDRNITWFMRSVSNRDEHLDVSGDGFDPNVNHKLAVEVRVEHGNRLGLLDYLYFMVYTITTTGYGDLVPVSGFAQLVATIANVYEVFFVVILVNILMAARSGYSDPDKATEIAASAVPSVTVPPT